MGNKNKIHMHTCIVTAIKLFITSIRRIYFPPLTLIFLASAKRKKRISKK